MTDSTTPIPTAMAKTPATKSSQSSSGLARARRAGRGAGAAPRAGTASSPRRTSTRPRSGPAVVEDHHLVDHRELEVRVRIVDRDAGVLGEQHDEQGDGDEERAPRAGRPSSVPVVGAWSIGVRLSEPEKRTSTTNAGEQRGLGEAREGHLARRSHALEGGARVERGRGREEAPERQQVGEQHEVAREARPGRRTRRREPGQPASRSALRLTTGPARNTQVVVRLKTIPLRNSRSRS